MIEENLEAEEQDQGIGDKKRARAPKAKQKYRDEREHNNLAVVLNSYDGRAFVWTVLSMCGMHAINPYYQNGGAQRHEGRREIGILLEGKVFTVSSELYRLMRDEAIERDKVER